MQKWEYAVRTYSSFNSAEEKTVEEWLNKNGEMGWELMTVAVFPDTHGNIGSTGSGSMGIYTQGEIATQFGIRFIFKRPKPTAK